jgi:hypothetical protein
MSGTEELTAVLLQLAGLTRELADIDHREAGHNRDAQARIAALTRQVSKLSDELSGPSGVLAAVVALDQRVADLAVAFDARIDYDDEPGGYQPSAQPRWWQSDDEARSDAVARLRGWVEQVYRPGYGHPAAGLGECWEQHPLCLYLLDWLSELWSALYLAPERTAGTLASQAEWHTRLLPAAASQLTAETRRCGHAATRHTPGQPGYRP